MWISTWLSRDQLIVCYIMKNYASKRLEHLVHNANSHNQWCAWHVGVAYMLLCMHVYVWSEQHIYQHERKEAAHVKFAIPAKVPISVKTSEVHPLTDPKAWGLASRDTRASSCGSEHGRANSLRNSTARLPISSQSHEPAEQSRAQKETSGGRWSKGISTMWWTFFS